MSDSQIYLRLIYLLERAELFRFSFPLKIKLFKSHLRIELRVQGYDQYNMVSIVYSQNKHNSIEPSTTIIHVAYDSSNIMKDDKK